MTAYSVMSTGNKATILATWGNDLGDTSVKVTTLDDMEDAVHLAASLTVMSEACWYAAAWLDTWEAISRHRLAVASWLREPEIGGTFPSIDLTAHRHADADASYEYTIACDLELLSAKSLSHPQRLALAEEITLDVNAARTTLEQLTSGQDEPLDRGWQLLEVSRVERFGGDLNYLLDGAAGWLTRWFDAQLTSELWAARGHLLRIEQLAAACEAAGGRARAHQEPVEAHCVLPGSTQSKDTIITAAPAHDARGYSRYSTRSPMQLTIRTDGTPARTTECDPYDTDTIVSFLGTWVERVPMRADLLPRDH